ncbi:hypothetical protein ACFQX6_62640 [Streptosporangium lutulentum]
MPKPVTSVRDADEAGGAVTRTVTRAVSRPVMTSITAAITAPGV